MKPNINPEVKRFFRSLCIFLFCMFFADLLIGSGLKYLYNRESAGRIYRTSYSLNTTTADFLVFGSSRANHHYDSQVFEKKLKATFYNCGREGQGAIYSCAIAENVIKRYKPKGIIIDIRPNEFTVSDKDLLSSILPYSDNKIVRKYINYKGRFEGVKLLSHIYPYNSLIGSLLVDNIPFFKERGKNYKGYIPLEGPGSAGRSISKYREGKKVDWEKVKYFKELLAKLDKAQIPTLIVLSPGYYIYKDGTTVNIAKNLCANYKSIRFLNFAHDDLVNNPDLFYDKLHLNGVGATKFSGELIAPMQAMLK